MSLLQISVQMTGQYKIIRALICAKVQTLKNALLNMNREKQVGVKNESSIYMSAH